MPTLAMNDENSGVWLPTMHCIHCSPSQSSKASGEPDRNGMRREFRSDVFRVQDAKGISVSYDNMSINANSRSLLAMHNLPHLSVLEYPRFPDIIWLIHSIAV